MLSQANTLRQLSPKGTLDSNDIIMIFNRKAGRNPSLNRTPTVKMNRAVYAKYFESGQSAKEIQGIVEKALDLYFSK